METAWTHSSWMLIMVVAFIGGIVANIVRPTRRGVIGFAASGLVSVFCGTVAAVCSKLDIEQQILVAAIVGVMSDKLLTWGLNFEFTQKVINNNFNAKNQQNQIGENNEQQ